MEWKYITENENIFIGTPPETSEWESTNSNNATDSFLKNELFAYFRNVNSLVLIRSRRKSIGCNTFINFSWHSFFKHSLRLCLQRLDKTCYITARTKILGSIIGCCNFYKLTV